MNMETIEKLTAERNRLQEDLQAAATKFVEQGERIRKLETALREIATPQPGDLTLRYSAILERMADVAAAALGESRIALVTAAVERLRCPSHPKATVSWTDEDCTYRCDSCGRQALAPASSTKGDADGV